MFHFICVGITICLLFGSGLGQKTIQDIEKEQIETLMRSYDANVRPSGYNSSQVVVSVSVSVRRIEHVCSDAMEWKPTVTIRQTWNDKRLQFSDDRIPYLVVEDVNRVWKPDLLFSNIRSKPEEVTRNSLLRVYPNGTIFYSTLLTLTLDCAQDLTRYPFDRQTCGLRITSNKYTANDIEFVWQEEDALQVWQSLNIPRFTLNNFVTDVCTTNSSFGEYSCLVANFQFTRISSYYARNWLLPTAVLTFVSFISFWLRRDKPRRILTLVATLVLLYLQITLINRSLPPVNYATAIDCWNSTCLLFVVAAIAEYGVVSAVDKCSKRFSANNRRKQDNHDDDALKKNDKNAEEGDAVALKPLVEEGQENHVEENCKDYTVNDVSKRSILVRKWNRSSLGSRIDIVAAIVFPLLFIVYIITFLVFENNGSD